MTMRIFKILKMTLGLAVLLQISASANQEIVASGQQGNLSVTGPINSASALVTTRDSILAITDLMIKTISGPKGAERDWDALKAVMVPQGQFMVARNGKVEVTPIASFLEKAPAMYGAVDFLEEALSNQVTINESVATVHQEYRCFVNGKPSHHGTNVYNLLRTETGWKIGYLMWYQISDRKPEPAKAK